MDMFWKGNKFHLLKIVYHGIKESEDPKEKKKKKDAKRNLSKI